MKKVLPGKKEPVIKLSMLLKIAATVIVVFSAGLILWRYQQNQVSNISNISPKLSKQQIHYASMIEVKQSELKRIEKEEPHLYQEFSEEIGKMEENYQKLKSDLPTSPNQEETVKAMIRNLQTQIEVLNQQLTIIKQINELKEKKMNNLYKYIFFIVLNMILLKPASGQEIKPDKPEKNKRKGLQLDEKMENLCLKLENLEIKLNNKDLKKLNLALDAINTGLTKTLNDLSIAVEDLDIDIRVHDFQNTGPDDNYKGAIEEKSKTISKTYAVSAKDKLDINNQFGKVTVNAWAKNEIKVDVEIKAYESTESRAQDLLNSVSVSQSRQGNLIGFKTNIESKTSSWWAVTGGGNNDRRGVQINYTIYMPSKNPLNVTNKYGSTVLPKLEGAVNINNSYGSFSAVALNNPANLIKVSYGSARINNFTAGNINVAYGSLSIEDAGRLNADVNKGGIKIGKLSGGGVLESKYGSVRINEIGKSIKNLTINSSYGGVSLGISEGVSFGFDVTVSYGGFNYSDSRLDLNNTDPNDDEKGFNSTKNYKGQCGEATSDSKILIKTRYGGVKFM